MFKSGGKYADFNSFLNLTGKIIEGQAADKEVVNCKKQIGCKLEKSTECLSKHSDTSMQKKLICLSPSPGYRIINSNDGECFSIKATNQRKTCYINNAGTCNNTYNSECVKIIKGQVVSTCSSSSISLAENKQGVETASGNSAVTCSPCKNNQIAVKYIKSTVGSIKLFSTPDPTTGPERVDFSNLDPTNDATLRGEFTNIIDPIEATASPKLYKVNNEFYLRTDNLKDYDKCMTCPSGYYKKGNDCNYKICICANGTPKKGAKCASHQNSDCASCNTGYHPTPAAQGTTKCEINKCLCPNGVEQTGTNCIPQGATNCASCNIGYHSSPLPNPNTHGHKRCYQNVCKCPGGSAYLGSNNIGRDGSAPDKKYVCTTPNKLRGQFAPKTECKSCNSGYAYKDAMSPVRMAAQFNLESSHAPTIQTKFFPRKECVRCPPGKWAQGSEQTHKVVNCISAKCANGTDDTDPSRKKNSCESCHNDYKWNKKSRKCDKCNTGEWAGIMTGPAGKGQHTNETCRPARCLYGADIPFDQRTVAKECASCNPGYRFHNKKCVAWGGTCQYGTLEAQNLRTKENHCGSCKPGYKLDPVTKTCVQCGEGTYSSLSSNTSNLCLSCPRGTYNDKKGRTGKVSCSPCPQGTYNGKTGGIARASCEPCPIGTHNNKTGKASCLACPKDEYIDTTGASNCRPCAAHERRPIGSSAKKCGYNICKCTNGTPVSIQSQKCLVHDQENCSACDRTHYLSGKKCVSAAAGKNCKETYIISPGTDPTCKPLCKLPSVSQALVGGNFLVWKEPLKGYEIVLPKNVKTSYNIYDGNSNTNQRTVRNHIKLDDLKKEGEIKIIDGWWREDQTDTKPIDIICDAAVPLSGSMPNQIKFTKGTPEPCIDYNNPIASKKKSVYKGCKKLYTPGKCSRYVIASINPFPTQKPPNKTDFGQIVKGRFKICDSPNPGFVLGKEGTNYFTNEYNTFRYSPKRFKWVGRKV